MKSREGPSPTPTSPIALFCRPCNRSFLHEAAIRQHIATAHTDSPVCRDCQRAFSNTEALRQHKAVFHGSVKIDGRSQILTCHPCRRTFATRMALVQHTATEAHKSTAKSLPRQKSDKARSPDEREARRGPELAPYPAVSSDASARGTLCELCLGNFDSAETLEEHKLQSHSWVMYCKTCRSYFADDSEAKQHYRVIHRMIGVDPSKMQTLAESLVQTQPLDPEDHDEECPETSSDNGIEAPWDRLESEEAADHATPSRQAHFCPACQKAFGNPYDLIRHRSSPCGSERQTDSERPKAVADSSAYSGGIDLGQDLPTFAFAPTTFVRHDIVATRPLADVADEEEIIGSSLVDAVVSSSEEDWEVDTPENDQDNEMLAHLGDHSVWPSLSRGTNAAIRPYAETVESTSGIESTVNADLSEPAAVEVLSTPHTSNKKDRFTSLQGGWPSVEQSDDVHRPIARRLSQNPGLPNGLETTQQNMPPQHSIASFDKASAPALVHPPRTPSHSDQGSPASSGIFYFPEKNPHHATFPDAPSSPSGSALYGVIERPQSLRADANAFRPSGAWGKPLAERLKQQDMGTTAPLRGVTPATSRIAHSDKELVHKSHSSVRSPSAGSSSFNTRSTSGSTKRPHARKTWAESFAQEEKDDESGWMPAFDRGWITHEEKPVAKSRGGKRMDAEATRRAEEERQRKVFEEERLQHIANGGEDPYGGW